MSRLSPAAVAVAALALGGCGGPSCSSASPTPSADAGAPLDPSAELRETRKGERLLLDITELPAACDVGHRGLFVDLGELDDASARVRGPRNTQARYDAVEHERSTFARVTGTELMVPVLGPETAWLRGTPLQIKVRALGAGARYMTVVVNGRVAGRANLTRGQNRVYTWTSSDLELNPGRNEIALRFPAQAAKGNDVAAEVDWVHIGPPDELGPFAAPTRANLQGAYRVDDQLLRGLLLRAPGHVRCLTSLKGGSRLRARLGAIGEGEATVRVLLSRDREEDVELGSFRVATDSVNYDGTTIKASGVQHVDVELPDADNVGALRFELESASKGLRVVLGEPRVIADKQDPVTVTTSHSVVLVVMGGVPQRHFSREGSPAGTALSALAQAGLVLPQHRLTSALTGANLAAMLTGTREHGMSAQCKLSPGVVSLPEALREAGVRSALFTANPWTTDAHGLHRGFAVYEALLPGDGQPSAKVYELAQAYAQKHAGERFFLVVHARGGHPPWDIGREVLKELPPQNYTGGLDPRHAGELLAKARTTPPQVRFTDADRERMWAMHKVAMEAEDQAFGRFYQAVNRAVGDATRSKGKVTWVVTGDGSIDDVSASPFGDGEVLLEQTLYPGLFLIGPQIAPRSSPAPTEATYVATSIAAAFGLKPPASFAPTTLQQAAADAHFSPLRLAELARRSLAERSRFSWMGQTNGELTRFCDLSLEPDCVTDVRAAYPLISFSVASDARALQRERKEPRCVPVDIDTAHQVALHNWGQR